MHDDTNHLGDGDHTGDDSGGDTGSNSETVDMSFDEAAASSDTAPAMVPEMVAEITAALEAAMRRAQVIDPQLRMFCRACADTGFALSADHVNIDEATGTVTITVDWRRFQLLTRQIEDVANASVSLARSAPSGPTLFDLDPPAGPVNPRPAGNGLHIEVPA